ncbi:MAG: hypothetical protein GY798_28115 [Hyphomicrobiales bacterium]|nr:hypothetical protein [Hyphomicrobiales bacterium]
MHLKPTPILGAVIAFLVSAALDSAAIAQDVKTAESGEETRIAVLGSFETDCEINPAPRVSVIEPAVHGTIRIVGATLETNRFPDCPGIKVPVQVVFYTSKPGFTGDDKAILEVSDRPGTSTIRTVSISVR